jgi:hypothetical protein
MYEAIDKRFCSCIKKVRRTVKSRTKGKEQAAIAICVKSVLKSKGKTLKKFSCRNGPKVSLRNL